MPSLGARIKAFAPRALIVFVGTTMTGSEGTLSDDGVAPIPVSAVAQYRVTFLSTAPARFGANRRASRLILGNSGIKCGAI